MIESGLTFKVGDTGREIMISGEWIHMTKGLTVHIPTQR